MSLLMIYVLVMMSSLMSYVFMVISLLMIYILVMMSLTMSHVLVVMSLLCINDDVIDISGDIFDVQASSRHYWVT